MIDEQTAGRGGPVGRHFTHTHTLIYSHTLTHSCTPTEIHSHTILVHTQSSSYIHTYILYTCTYTFIYSTHTHILYIHTILTFSHTLHMCIDTHILYTELYTHTIPTLHTNAIHKLFYSLLTPTLYMLYPTLTLGHQHPGIPTVVLWARTQPPLPFKLFGH